MLIRRTSLKTAWIYGFIYGAISYGLFSNWLANFNPYTIYLGLPVFGVILALVFELMRAASRLFPDRDFHAMALVWLIYEFLKTKGFLGYPYGIIGYTQWNVGVLIQSASFGGVWWVSLLCVTASTLIAYLVRLFLDPKERKGGVLCVISRFWKERLILTSAFFALMGFTVVYGIVRLNVGDGKCTEVSLACIQNNTDSNKYGFEVYLRDVEKLKELSEKALEENPKLDFIIWPETAVVPPFVYNYQSRSEPKRYAMVCDLVDFMSVTDSCFVFGNQSTVDNGGEYMDDYNSVLVFDTRRKNVNPPVPETYYKIHLVPFTEYFPYDRLFPWLYDKLLMGDTHLWTPGTEAKVFNERGISFSTPICFEDTFGSLCRTFVKNGARCFFNLSNDSWSGSANCQMQHLSMAVFRSVENAVPTARATASGATCLIDSRGRISGTLEFFKADYLSGSISVPDEYSPTAYNALGDWLPVLEIILAAASLVYGIVRLIYRQKKAGRATLKNRGKRGRM